MEKYGAWQHAITVPVLGRRMGTDGYLELDNQLLNAKFVSSGPVLDYLLKEMDGIPEDATQSDFFFWDTQHTHMHTHISRTHRQMDSLAACLKRETNS